METNDDVAMSEASHNIGRSLEEIANYLQQIIPPESWRKGEPAAEDVSEWSEMIKERWDRYSLSVDRLKDTMDGFFSDKIKEELLETTVEKLVEFLQGPNNIAKSERKMVGISHLVKDTKLTHDFDVDELRERIYHVFKTFYDNKNKGEDGGYYAPYLCFVQSSGMGKTKIMYELCKSYNKLDKDQDICGQLVLCRSAKSGAEGEKERALFHHFINLKSDEHLHQDFQGILNDIFHKLEELLVGIAHKKRVVLFFDEAQHLLHNGEYLGGDNTKKTLQAMLFRIVRLWICTIRTNHEIVAVFTGTTANLTNFIIPNDLIGEDKTDTRDRRKDKDYFDLVGHELYKPFFTTTTIGCLRFDTSQPSGQVNDYSIAVPRGRPLFPSMTAQELKNAEAEIVSRIVHDTKSLEDSPEAAWLSVLGTRAQMGQTTLPLASSLVARSYANVVGVTHSDDEKPRLESIKICFQPDPVCARLAMCLMDGGWSMYLSNASTLNGKDKTWWVGKMKELYSKNICSPEKGDLGEVMVALYFLFCADTLRCQLDKHYTTFSVPLDQWIKCLVNGGSSEQGEVEKKTANNKINVTTRSQSKVNHDCQIDFSAIQVCRNYIRAYDDSWSWLQNEVFLENMYKTGVGFYVFPGCGTIDLVFALRVGRTNIKYVPMFVSAKSHVYFGPGAAIEECKKMESKAKGTNGALCVLVIFGSSSDSKDGDFALSKCPCEDVAAGNIVSKVLRIPADDEFGLSAAFLDLTTMQDEMSEVLASHSFLSAHMEAHKGNDKVCDDFATKVLRLRPKKNSNTAVRREDDVTRKAGKLLTMLGKIGEKKETDRMDTS